MRLGIWEILLIVIVIVLLFSGNRITRLMGAFRRSRTEYREGLEEPVDVESRYIPDETEETQRKR